MLATAYQGSFGKFANAAPSINGFFQARGTAGAIRGGPQMFARYFGVPPWLDSRCGRASRTTAFRSASASGRVVCFTPEP